MLDRMYLKKGNYYNNFTFNPSKRIQVFYWCATEDIKPYNFDSIICFIITTVPKLYNTLIYRGCIQSANMFMN